MIDYPDIYHISSLHLISHFDCPCSGAAQPGTELGSQRWWWENFGPYGGGNGQWGKETYVKSPKYIDDWRFLVYSNFKPKSKGRTFSTGTYFLDWGRISIRNVILTCLCSPSRVLVYIWSPPPQDLPMSYFNFIYSIKCLFCKSKKWFVFWFPF